MVKKSVFYVGSPKINQYFWYKFDTFKPRPL